MPFYWLVLGVLAVWRITHLFHAEDGPWNVMGELRRLAGAGFWGELLDCFYCLSVWVAAPFAYWLGERWTEQLLLWPALSGGAILAERLTARADPVQPALYVEDKEDEDVLRKQAVAIPRDDDRSTPA